jgi:hypothetical protein
MRVAFNLGLNLDPTGLRNAGTISEDDMNVRQVAWWGCYTLDKFVAMSTSVAA